MPADWPENEKPYPDFDILFRAMQPALIRYARGALKNHADADDAVQTAGFNVYRNWATVELLGPAWQRHYLRLAVHNQVRQEWRKRQSRWEDLSADPAEARNEQRPSAASRSGGRAEGEMT